MRVSFFDRNEIHLPFRDEGGRQRRRDFSLICLKKMSERGKGKGLATFALSSSSSSSSSSASSSPASSLLDHHLLGDEREEERLERRRYDYQYYSGDDDGVEDALLSDFDELEYDDKTIFDIEGEEEEEEKEEEKDLRDVRALRDAGYNSLLQVWREKNINLSNSNIVAGQGVKETLSEPPKLHRS